MITFQAFRSKKIFLLVFLLPLLAGCEKDPTESLDKIVSKTLQVSDAALEQVGNLDPNEAKQEFKKLSQFEYQVVSLKKDISSSELEGRLAVYGTKGFDCSGPVIREIDLIMVCKKRPESVLRYLPQTIVGRP